MNPSSARFFRQASSDWSVFCHFRTPANRFEALVRRAHWELAGLRPLIFPPCHELHYLQMCTEKLAKAYFATPGRLTHSAFRRFMTDVQSNPCAVAPLGFADVASMTRWAGSIRPIVEAVEDLAPSIADQNNLPNPEYPWPRGNEQHAPADHSFQALIYAHLDAQANSGQRPFLNVLDAMVRTMGPAAWHL